MSMKTKELREAWEALPNPLQLLIVAMYANEDSIRHRGPGGWRGPDAPNGPRWLPYAANSQGSTWPAQGLPAGFPKPTAWRRLGRALPRMMTLKDMGLAEVDFAHHAGRGEKVCFARLTNHARAMARAGGAIPPKQRRGLNRPQFHLLLRVCEEGPVSEELVRGAAGDQLLGKGLLEAMDRDQVRPESGRTVTVRFLQATQAGKAKYASVKTELTELFGDGQSRREAS